MSGVVSIPHHTSRVLAGWAFGTLMERLEQESESVDDKYLAQQADALHGLHFSLMDDDTAQRLAARLATVAHELRTELVEQGSDDPRDIGFIDYLAELEMQLEDFIAAPDEAADDP